MQSQVNQPSGLLPIVSRDGNHCLRIVGSTLMTAIAAEGPEVRLLQLLRRSLLNLALGHPCCAKVPAKGALALLGRNAGQPVIASFDDLTR